VTDQPTTKEQTLKPTLGEDITELFSRVAKLNDQMAAVLAPEWGARMGIIPEGHPLHPGVSCSPAAPESEPNHPRTTLDNPATSSAWTPPPPGDRREQLPDAILALLPAKPYLSTACDTAQQLEQAPAPIPTSSGAIPNVPWYAERMHARCRLQHKFTGMPCSCPCHQPAEPPVHIGGQANAEDCPACKGTNPDYPFICPGPDTAAVDEVDEAAGAWTPDPPIGCLTVTAERTPSQLPELRDQLADATVPLLLDTLPKVIARSRGYEVADAVMTLLYREWPWLRAEAEERDQPGATLPALTPCTCRQSVHTREHGTPVDGCPWCTPNPDRQTGQTDAATAPTGDLL